MAPINPWGRKIRFEQPILTLTAKEFMTGIAESAHSGKGGIFYKAAGFAPVQQYGRAESPDNGVLRAGPALTDLTSNVVVDTPVACARLYIGGNAAYLCILGTSGHFYLLQASTHTLSDLRSGSPAPISNPSNGMGVFQPAGGTQYVYYTMKTAIGRAKTLNSGPVFNDTWVTGLNSDSRHPMHRYFDKLMYGNLNTVGAISDNLSGDTSNNSNVLDVPVDSVITALGDDGIYLAIAITDNIGAFNAYSNCRILFWDGNADSWLREYPINDEYIYSMQRVGNSLLVQGRRGIYQVSFGSGVKKVLSRATGGGSGNLAVGPALSSVINQNALAFGASFESDGSVGMLGQLNDDAPSAFYKPILVSGNQSVNATLVEASFERGNVFVGTDLPALGFYNFASATGGQTGVQAQTVYISFPLKYQIDRIDVIMATPMISGDQFQIGTIKSETEAIVNFGRDIAYATESNKRHIVITSRNPVVADEAISFTLYVEGGYPKIKTIQVYGQLMTP